MACLLPKTEEATHPGDSQDNQGADCTARPYGEAYHEEEGRVHREIAGSPSEESSGETKESSFQLVGTWAKYNSGLVGHVSESTIIQEETQPIR